MEELEQINSGEVGSDSDDNVTTSSPEPERLRSPHELMLRAQMKRKEKQRRQSQARLKSSNLLSDEGPDPDRIAEILDLPDDVLKVLSARLMPDDRLHFIQTCKRMHSVCADPLIWSSLPSELTLTDSLIGALASRLSLVTTFTLEKNDSISSVALRALFRGMPSLESLSLKEVEWLDDKCLEPLSRCTNMQSLSMVDCPHLTGEGLLQLNTLSRLQELFARTMHGLRKVHICPCQSEISESVAKLIKANPRLTDLDLCRPHPVYDELRGRNMEGIASLQDDCIKYLGRCHRMKSIRAEFQNAECDVTFCKKMPLLENVTLRCPHNMSGGCLAQLAETAGANLKYLEISCTDTLTDIGLVGLGQYSPNLHTLLLDCSLNVSTSAFHSLINGCPLLTSLHIGCSQTTSYKIDIDDSDLLILQQKLPALTDLALNGLPNVSDQAFAIVAQFTGLVSLDAHSWNLTPAAMPYICAAPVLRKLAVQLVDVSSLSQLSTLRELTVTQPVNYTEFDEKAWISCCSLPQVEKLHFYLEDIGKGISAALSQVSNPNLKTLVFTSAWNVEEKTVFSQLLRSFPCLETFMSEDWNGLNDLAVCYDKAAVTQHPLKNLHLYQSRLGLGSLKMFSCFPKLEFLSAFHCLTASTGFLRGVDKERPTDKQFAEAWVQALKEGFPSLHSLRFPDWNGGDKKIMTKRELQERAGRRLKLINDDW